MDKKFAFMYLCAGLLVALIFFVWLYFDAKAEQYRLKQNQSLLLHNGKVEITETNSGNSHASMPAITLRTDEFKQGRDTLAKVAKEVGIKPSRISDAATASTVTSADVETPVIHPSNDSLCAHPPADSLVCFSWHDAWMSLSGCVSDSLFRGTITSADTLDIIVHRVPKRFLFFRFGCREVRMDIVSRNPHTRLSYARYYKIIR